MGKHHRFSNQLSPLELKSIDCKSRSRIEELYALTDEIVNGRHDMNNKYDRKLYKKYKELKELNRKLQEKLINQHCLGCKCVHQTMKENEQQTENSILSGPSRSSTLTVNNKIKASNESVMEKTQYDNEIVLESSSDEDEIDGDDEASVDISVNVPKVTTNDNAVQEDGITDDGISRLPSPLQAIIRYRIRKSKNSNAYLLKLGLYPMICNYLCTKLPETFYTRPSQPCVRQFILNEVQHQSIDYAETFSIVSDELCDIHQSYMLKFMTNFHDKSSKFIRKKNSKRKSF